VTRFLRPLLLALLLAAASATPALADVHQVSEADCAAPGAPSGASADGSRSAPGRPDGQIPIEAGGLEEGQARDDAPGKFCDPDL
jgi:hypothetical protein